MEVSVETLLIIHSLWRWVLLLVAVVTVLIGLIGWLTRQSWSPLPATLSRLFPIVIDLQVLLGLALWIAEEQWAGNFYFRFLHPLMGVAALAIAHVVSVLIKRSPGEQGRYRLMALGYLFVLIVAALAVPQDRWFLRGL